jgi:hypothetical protein
MMRVRPKGYGLLFGVAWLILGGTRNALPAPPSGTQSVLQGIYNKVNAAAAKKDIKTLWQYRTPDYAYVSAKGKTYTAAQIRPQEKAVIGGAEKVRISSVIQKLTPKGSAADVVVKESGLFVLNNPKTRKKVTVQVNSHSLDTWVKRNGSWKVRRSKTLDKRTTINGKLQSNDE